MLNKGNPPKDGDTESEHEHSAEDRYYTLLNSLNDAVFVHDFKGNFIEVNSEAARRLGYSKDELLTMGPKDIDTPEFASLVESRIRQLEKEGHLVFETVHITKEGQRIPVELSSTVVKFNGKPAIISVARDISTRKHFEKALEESQERLALVIEGSGLGTWDWNIETDEVVFNDRWANMLGYDLSDIKPTLKAWKELVHPDDLPRVMEVLNRHLEGETETYNTEHRMRAKDGSWIWIEDRGMVVERDREGQPMRATGTHLDITERKRAQEALQAERRKLLEIFDSIDEFIYVVDPKTYEILFVNEYMKEQFGAELIGGICYQEFQGFDEPCDFCTNQIIRDNPGEPYQWEYHNPVLDIDLLITDRIIRWSDGRRVRFEIAIDITDQKRAERNLRDSKRELELYTSLLRHDLANDMQLLINRLEYVEMLDNVSEMKQQCAQVRAASERMGKLLKLFTEAKPGQSNGLIDTIETSIEQSKETNPDLVVVLDMDRKKNKLNHKMGELLGLVFDNLLRNSAQHVGPDAEVSISVEGGKNDIFVRLSDNGPGIPESVQPALFQRKGSVKGGMGLYLSKRVVEAYGGEFSLCESESDGACFEIRLPKPSEDF